MAALDSINNTLLQSRLNNIALRRAIGTAVERKTLDAARQQGQAAIALLDAAAQLGPAAIGETPPLTLGRLASGLGRNLDLSA